MTIDRDDQLKVRLTTGEKALLQRVAEAEDKTMSAWLREHVYLDAVRLAENRLFQRAGRQVGDCAFSTLDETDFANVFGDVFGEVLDGLDMNMLFWVLRRIGAGAAISGEGHRELTFLEQLADWLVSQSIDDMRVESIRRVALERLARRVINGEI